MKHVYGLAVFSLLVVLSACDSATDQAKSLGLSSDVSSDVSADVEEVANQDAESSTNGGRKKPSQLYLGTGSVQGVYFPIGGVICRLLNRHKELHSLRCTLESTGGSIYNLRELRNGNFDLVVAQSDWQYHAYNGSSTFEKDGPNKDLRAVFALEADPLALIVKKDSGIKSFDDLADRVVSFGYGRSLQHRIINDLLAAKGWTDDNFKQVRRMSDTKQIGELCEGNVEAILLLSSSLNDYLKTIADGCELQLVPIEGDEIAQVIKQKPYYRTGKILAGLPVNEDNDVMSFGLGATFVASKSTSPKAIYNVVKEVVENFRDFKSLHPSLKTLDQNDLPHAGISIPLHPGAIRYYREARLLK